MVRLGSATLSEMMENETIELLEALDLRYLSAHKLAQLIVRQKGAEDLLLEPAIRKRITAALKLEDAKSLTTILGQQVESPDDCWRVLGELPFNRNSPAFIKLCDFFGVELLESGMDLTSQVSKNIEIEYGLFEHQRTACIEVDHILANNTPRLVLHMPTGSGKTRTAMHVLSQWINSHPLDSAVVWLAHTEELCEQAAEEFERAWRSLGNFKCTLHRHFGPYRTNLGSVRGGFLVAGLQKLYQDSLSQLEIFYDLCTQVSLVVFDEAHQAIAPTYKHLMDMLAPNNSNKGVLGLTATPGRTHDNDEEDRKLADFFARQKVTLHMPGYDSPINYLEEKGYLSKVTYEQLPFDPKGAITLTDPEKEHLREGFDLSSRVLASLASNYARNLILLKEIIKEASDGNKILVFACSVQHAELLADLLRAKGVTAASITSNTRSDRRRHLISQYREKEEPQVLTNYGVLTTGFDAPKTNVAVIARPTQSVVLYSQMVGRAARGKEAGGTEECKILTVVDDIPGLRNLAEGFSFWEELWSD